ncbi:MAG TPA: endonuclease domain-containing protein [Bacteroidales bacterium]|nr:endonuclease domain-containing protein [Bacteroidales bacterium]
MPLIKKAIEREMYIGAKQELFKRASEMRKNPTTSEEVLWNALRQYRSHNIIFRRQHPVDIFIADFYCHKLHLIIEVDGAIHDSEEATEYDDGRTAELEKYGIEVIRFSNEQVLTDISSVLRQIDEKIKERTNN